MWSVLVCRIAIITDNSRGGRHRNHPKAERTEQMKIEKIYESIMSAGRDVERTDGAICQALRNESRTCAGYHWKYLDE